MQHSRPHGEYLGGTEQFAIRSAQDELLSVAPGDWVIRIGSRFLPCPPELFAALTQQQADEITRDLPEGLSMSDVVRLAVSRLQDDVANGLNLTPALAERAHADAEIFIGRRNRGLPSQHEQTA